MAEDEMTATEEAAARLARRAFPIPAPEAIAKAQTIRGAWTALQLAEWGISWPPPIGWRHYLNTLHHWYGRAYTHHDTVFDREFQKKWLRITSEEDIPLVNPGFGDS